MRPLVHRTLRLRQGENARSIKNFSEIVVHHRRAPTPCTRIQTIAYPNPNHPPSIPQSTVAYTLEHALFQRGKIAQVLDGDNIRHGLNSNLGFSPEDREENIRRIGEVGKLFADSGMITLISFISPYRKDRDTVRERCGDKFVEVYMKIPLEVRVFFNYQLCTGNWTDVVFFNVNRFANNGIPKDCTKPPGLVRSRDSPGSTTRTRNRWTRRSSWRLRRRAATVP